MTDGDEKGKERMNTRELILDMLMEMETEETYSNILIRNVLDKYDYLSSREKAFIKRVTEGTLERRIQIDHIIDFFSKIPVAKMKPFIRNLLRMSVYQILFMDGIPDSAACNEAVKLAVKRKFHSLKGFVNGVLRSISRKKEEQGKNGAAAFENIYPDKRQKPLQYLSVVYSMPEEITSMWVEEYGIEKTEQLLKAMLEIHPVTVRLKENLTKKEKEQLLKEMEEMGIGIAPHPYLSYAYELTNLWGVRNIPGFQEGLFTVQDVSSMLCVECADIKEGSLVVDVCAAPGGKSTLAAEKLAGTGKVIARDISEEKKALIEENIHRQQLVNVKPEVYDATVWDENLTEKADVVLADLPCSGLGVLGKKRDIKYHVTKEMLTELPLLQKKILDAAWHYVKPGGTLVYSTCTIHKKENEEIVQWFLENYPFEPVPIGEYLKTIPPHETMAKGYIQLLPGEHKTDGFFFAKFRRTI